MVTFSVKNFEKFQHYKDRKPPWIKFHHEVFEDYDFARLPDASKMHLVAIWSLASRYENEIPYDADWIAKRIGASDPVDLEMLVSHGFIVVKDEQNQPCSKPLAKRKQNSMPEKEEETESETEIDRGAKRAQRATQLPKDFKPDLSYAIQGGMTEAQAAEEAEKFSDHHRAKGSALKDWDAAWRNWVRRWKDFTPKNGKPVNGVKDFATSAKRNDLWRKYQKGEITRDQFQREAYGT